MPPHLSLADLQRRSEFLLCESQHPCRLHVQLLPLEHVDELRLLLEGTVNMKIEEDSDADEEQEEVKTGVKQEAEERIPKGKFTGTPWICKACVSNVHKT